MLNFHSTKEDKMKTTIFVVIALLLFSSCKEDASPVEVEVVLKDSTVADITLELISQEPYQGISNVLIATFCLSNNSNKTFDSVKVTFANVTTPRTLSFYNMKPTEKYYPAVTYNAANTPTIKTTVEWW